MSDETEAERYYEEQRERAAYEDWVAAKDAEDWRAMEVELTALRRVAEAAREVAAWDPSAFDGTSQADDLADLREALAALPRKEGTL